MTERLQSKEIAKLLLEASDNMLDACMKPYIEKWSDPPKAVELLEVLDRCIFSALASSVVIITLETLYKDALVNENLTHEFVAETQATWRGKL